ncbi:C-type lectin-like protein [Fowlpox virus]|uniref:Putative C-type lectin protein FPV239 n=3 Tax=Fowlpox virus TaxID=10261 RepID=V239_FOWPN|nr:C-type lectin-like protein [Fowlpox virus]P14371.2 RecName: Full=Putative C-type lectin protein FPV239; AltName: Full=BamHI-ORF8 [Fowlpox virus strain NVSL]UNS14483.1 ALPV-319 [Albatrosspox virus]WPD90983.1 A40-like C-type lectin family protein [Avipoxvirus sp.]AAF44583.1 ORF FPV239 C-type lectin gene family protein [Fowlpox virus]ART91671.1 C-type lectin family protein [Fowlpox virus]AXY04679.1 C-type lectin-like protein [Fowlpox virus]
MEEGKPRRSSAVLWMLIPCGSIIIVLSVFVIILSTRPPVPPDIKILYCKEGWVGYNKNCYFFSEEKNNKSLAVERCKDMDGHLTSISSKEEFKFILRYKGPGNHWIGIEKVDFNGTWKLEDGSSYDNIVPIKGIGDCAYLSDRSIMSSFCFLPKKWICRIILL